MLRMKAELVRLHNLVVELTSNNTFLYQENRTMEQELRREYESQLDFYKSKCKEGDRIINGLRKENASLRESDDALKEEVEGLRHAEEIAEAAKQANIDYKDVIQVMSRRTYERQSDATRFLNGEMDLLKPDLEEMGLDAMVKHIMDKFDGKGGSGPKATGEKAGRQPKVKLPKETVREARKAACPGRKRVWTATELVKFGIDTSNLPANARLVRRKSKADGMDTWYIQLIYFDKAKVRIEEHRTGRFSVPGVGLMDSKRPRSVIKGNPLMPDFMSFYLNNKYNYCMSGNRILKMLKEMGTNIPQATLNFHVHQIMALLRSKLEPMMPREIRRSHFTHNDETRILVRSREKKGAPFKYNTEYIHAALSPGKKLVVMLYREGSRGHRIPQEEIFRDSEIKCFLADRAPIYTTLVKNLEEYELVRAACWFHARHYLVDAYLVDGRMESLIMLVNLLFRIERESAERKHTPSQRLAFRLKYSQPIVSRIMKELETIKAAGKEYGAMVHRAVNYMLEDKEAFQRFLTDGCIEMHNNAIERMFRNIALGRRNWLHTGSHFSAGNIAFMFSLVESCKLNGVNFGDYIEDILTRIKDGEDIDESVLPNRYVPRQESACKKAV